MVFEIECAKIYSLCYYTLTDMNNLGNFFTKSFFVLFTCGVFQACGFVKEYVNFSIEIVVSELELNISTDAISYKS